MAALFLKCVQLVRPSVVVRGGDLSIWPQQQAVRTFYTDWRMIRDLKRRETCVQYAAQRCRINSIRKNKIIPKAIKELADLEIAALPRNSAKHRITSRCVVTSRGRGVLVHWRLSRIVFRRLCDYNLMSGAQRAMW